MSQLELRALRGDHPLAFLAALGVARLAQEDCERETRLGWPRGPRNGAAIEVDGVSTVDELAELLFGVVASMQRDDHLIPNIGDFPPRKNAAGFDPFKALGRSELRALAIGCRSDNSRARWIAGVVAVGGDPEHRSFKKSAGLLTTNKTTAVDRYLSHSRDSIEDWSALRFAMLSWRRRTGSNPAAYLDPSAVRDAGSTNAEETPNYADPAVVWLALMAVPLFPVVGRDNGSTSTTNWARKYRASSFGWPVWAPMLPLAAIGPLLAHPAVTRRTERCAALGISAVFESVRQAGSKAEGVLGAADQIWPKRTP